MKLSEASASKIIALNLAPLECFFASLTLLWKRSETFKIDGPNLGALVLSRSRAYTAILYGYNKQDTVINLY